MGCVKSKRASQTSGANSAAKVDGRPESQGGEKAVLVSAEVGPGQDSPRVNAVLLDYAERLSEDILSRAVQQWAELDSRYSDIPYIECDVP
ncbi:small membrane A-kinase anchor protein-like [Brienomyrus brachyistius]|uniref:small membrane A-kinase anchor protein-like n=1 Tax=Brienomyrus brachyistius TaxID=42636 RepID=UPI0020B1BE8C|nr:small membrane A-kinase anchor protein-like [Brienomyrus brachyistius]